MTFPFIRFPTTRICARCDRPVALMAAVVADQWDAVNGRWVETLVHADREVCRNG